MARTRVGISPELYKQGTSIRIALIIIVVLSQILISTSQLVNADEIPRSINSGIANTSENGNDLTVTGINAPQSDVINPIWLKAWQIGLDTRITSVTTDGLFVYTVGNGIFLLKYSSDGISIWNKTWSGGNSYNEALSIALSDPYLFVAGGTKKNGASSTDVILLKYNVNGDLLWNKTWGSNNDESAHAVAVDSHNIYVTGWTTNQTQNIVDVFLLKYDLNGNLLWDKTWDGGFSDRAESIALDGSNVYICGYTAKDNSSIVDMLLLKYDLDGNLIWNKTWGGKNNDWAYSIALDRSYIFITGQTNSYGIGLDDVVLLKYDLNGNLFWNRTWGGNDTESGRSIALDDSNIYIAGWTSSYGSGARDAVVLKYDFNGNFLWSKTWGSYRNEWANSIAVGNSSLYIAGWKESNYNINDGYLLKCDLDGGNSSYPFVVNTIPMNGSTNISLNTDILISFSEAMLKNQTENAISSVPSISGPVTWDPMEKRMIWAPSNPLQKNMNYTITISTDAKSKRNFNLQKPFSFSFTTSSFPDTYPPHIISTTPANGSIDISIATKIAIQWNESMNRISAESAFSSTPKVSCEWSWSNFVQICKSVVLLQSSTKYTVTISTAAKDLAGNALPTPYLFYFTTKARIPVPPIITRTEPPNNALNVPTNMSMTITFSEKMDKISTEGAISISPSIIGTFAWNTTGEKLTLDPNMDLQAHTWYSITIGTNARSSYGLNLRTSYTFSFTTAVIQDITPPHVVSTYPASNENNVDIETKILVIFSEPMNETATSAAVSISLGSITNKSWSNDSKILTITAILEEGKTYMVILSTDAKDVAGNAMMSRYNFSFTTKNGPLVSENITMLLGLIVLVAIIVLLLLLIMLRIKSKKQTSKKPQFKPTETKDEKLEEIKKESEGTKEKQIKSRKVAIENIHNRREQMKKIKRED